MRLLLKFLTGKYPVSKQVVVSGSPAYGEYNNMAITYLYNGEFVSENFQTKKGYDL